MPVYVTREYQQGIESGEARAYSNLESAQRSLESNVPPRDRIVWKERHPGRWLGRIPGRFRECSLYIDALDILD